MKQGLQIHLGHAKASKETCFANDSDIRYRGGRPLQSEAVLVNIASVGVELHKEWWRKGNDHAPETGDYHSLAHRPERRPQMFDVQSGHLHAHII